MEEFVDRPNVPEGEGELVGKLDDLGLGLGAGHVDQLVHGLQPPQLLPELRLGRVHQGKDALEQVVLEPGKGLDGQAAGCRFHQGPQVLGRPVVWWVKRMGWVDVDGWDGWGRQTARHAYLVRVGAFLLLSPWIRWTRDAFSISSVAMVVVMPAAACYGRRQ